MNRASAMGKWLMEWRYIMRETIIPHLIHLKNPLKVMGEYRKRGMSFYTAVKNWVGDTLTNTQRLKRFFSSAEKWLGLELINIRTGEANTEYLFRKR